MENNNVFLGKIERAGCYVNNGKYGYFLTCNKKNYKLPEFLLPEEVTLDMAKRKIAYKQKYQNSGWKRRRILKIKMKVKMKMKMTANHLKKKWY